MRILNSNRELSAVEMYTMTKDPEIVRMVDYVEAGIDVDLWVLYEVEDAEGGMRNILSVRDTSGVVYATNSSTFQKSFLEMVEMFHGIGEEIPPIKVLSGTSKSGRQFIDCGIVKD